jgi:hypothetical protein
MIKKISQLLLPIMLLITIFLGPTLTHVAAAVPTDWRAGVPEPVLANHSGWIDYYYDTWRIADLKKQQRPTGWIFDSSFSTTQTWMWDECWIQCFGKYAQGAHPQVNNAMNGIDLFYSQQQADGFIPHVWSSTIPSVHNPILAMAEIVYYNHCADQSRLSTVLPKLDRFYDACKLKSGSPDGLYYNTTWNNGMDNRPTSDQIIDLTAEQAVVAMYIKQIADIVGNSSLSSKYNTEYNNLKAAINQKMWSTSDRFYVDVTNSMQQVNNWTVGAFWPLMAKVADTTQASYLVTALQDPANFNTPHRIPSIGKKSPSYNANGGDYWRGAVWAPTNAMTIKGLTDYGYEDLAREIAINHLEALYQTWLRTNTLYENYDQERVGYQGGNAKSDFVGWSGVTPIATLIEHIIGVRINAPQNKIVWQLRLAEQNGVRNLKWGPNWQNKVDLVARARGSVNESVTIDLSSTSSFTLEVNTGWTTQTFNVTAGNNQVLQIPYTGSSGVIDVSHSGTGNYYFGQTSDQIKRWQTFIANQNPTITSVDVKIQKANGTTQSNVTVELFATSANKPTGSALASAAIPAGSVGTVMTVVNAPLQYSGLVNGTKYAIVLGQQTPQAALYGWCTGEINSNYQFGKWNGTSWVDESTLGDGWMKVYVSSGSTPTPTPATTPTPTPTVTPSPTPGIAYYALKCKDTSGGNRFLYDNNDQLSYGSSVANDTYRWQLENANGYTQIKNKSTGHYISIEHLYSYVECIAVNSAWHSKDWTLVDAGSGNKKIKCRWLEHQDYIHVQNSQGYAERGTDPGTDKGVWVFEVN